MKIKNTNKFNNLYLTMYYLKLSMKNKCCFKKLQILKITYFYYRFLK